MASASSEILASAKGELQATSAEVKRYERQKLFATLTATALSLAVLAFMALSGGPRLDAFLRQWSWIDNNVWLRLVVLGLVYAVGFELLSLPISFWSGFILEHRYQLSNQTFRAWLWRQVKGYLIGGLLGLAMLLGLYALLWYGGSLWWLWAALGWLVVTLLLGQLLPVIILPLFYKITRLEDAALIGRLQQLVVGTGLNVEGVYRMELSAETKKANAMLAGLGRTRRVLLGDTLLQEFTPEEIEVVFAHEVGHHVHRHLPKLVVWSVVLAMAGLWLVHQVLVTTASALGYLATDQLAAYQNPAALPLVLLVLALFGLALAPLQNAVSRFFEKQCDRYALVRTGSHAAYRSAFTKLARMNKTDPDPHPLVVWLFDDHPPIRQRLALAETVAVVAPAGSRAPLS